MAQNGSAQGSGCCPLCGSGEARALGVSANGPLVRCAHCTLTYHVNLLGLADRETALGGAAEVAPYYGDEAAYAAYREQKEPQWRDLFGRLWRYLPRDCARGERAARLLDVGCARGYSTALARRLGFEAYGVEVSAADARYAREQLGLPVEAGSVEQARFPDDFFDAVVLWVVLEHLAQPREALAEIARILRPGGVVNIFTPNGASRAARAQGLAWTEYNRPGHAVFFCPATVRRLLEEQGLQVVELYTTLAVGAGGKSEAAPWYMRPALAPLRRRGRQLIGALAPGIARRGEYMGVYAKKAAR